MHKSALTTALIVLLAALGALGCVDPKAGDTSLTPIYVYDEANKQVVAWNDVNTLYNLGAGGTAPAPDRTITGTLITGLGTLAWGGMVFNPSTNELFLVSETGNVVRIEKAQTQSGALSQNLDIVTFTLGGSSDRLANSLFAQAAIDTSTGNLYVMETGSNNQWRIWIVSAPNNIAANGQAPAGTYLQGNLLSSDTGGWGVAAGTSGSVFGLFTGGSVITDDLLRQYDGPRLRLSSGASFPLLQNVLVGGTTQLWDGTNTPAYGSLAFDTTLNRLYVARPISGGNAVLAFDQSQFTGGTMNQAPSNHLADDAATLSALRTISHARAKDWLAGLDFDSASDAGTALLHLWKGPSQGGASLTLNLASGVQARGVAMDGSM